MRPVVTTFFRIGAIALALAIVVLSLQPVTGTASIQHADKVQHLLAYGALAGLTGLGWPRLSIALAVAGSIAFGIGIEVAQGLGSAGRTASVADALANALGAGLAGLALRYIRAR